MKSSPDRETVRHRSPERPGGAVIGDRYVVLRRLGAGSLGTVYLTRDTATGRDVALKLLRTDRLTSAAIEGLQREFQTIASIRHPRIATAYDFGYVDDGRVPYFTREYVPGSPLAAGPPVGQAPAEFLRPILDLLDALDTLHTNGLLHLDIHAGNLIVADDSERGAVLIDFGLVRDSIGAHSGGAGCYSGPSTPRLAAAASSNLGPSLPALEATASTDLFLVGRLLIERLTGRTDGRPELPAEIPGWGPRRTLGLERIAAKALQRQPEQRFRSAAEFAEALQRVVGEFHASDRSVEPIAVTLGRDAELQRIESSLRELAHGRSSLTEFSGASGLGKSRLLEEARVRAQLRGLHVVSVRFRDTGDPEPALQAALKRSLRATERRWLRSLSARHGGTPAERGRRASDVFFAESGNPLVLLLDDVDHADPDSALLVDALRFALLRADDEDAARRALALVTTQREAPATRHRRQDFVRLRPLTRKHARDLLGGLLRPLEVPRSIVDRVLTIARGRPQRLRQIAAALHFEWDRSGLVPPTASIPDVGPVGGATGLPASIENDSRMSLVLCAIAVIRRAATCDEIATATGLEPRDVAQRLRQLRRFEVVEPRGRGRSRRFSLVGQDLIERCVARTPPARRRRFHERLAQHLIDAATADPQPADLAFTAEHLIACGRLREGCEYALDAAEKLRRLGSHDFALRLLDAALRAETRVRTRLRLVEAMSSLLEETGDHARGVALLEPFLEEPSIPRSRAVGIRRRLGIHLHRTTKADEALRVFEECRELASRAPGRHVEDLIFVDSELAEIAIYRGEYTRAEEACRRGLQRLAQVSREPFCSRMEVILRATLGHLDLRRLRLESARAELRRALEGIAEHGAPALEAIILNNLGIVERQLNRFDVARRRFRRAERLLSRAGEGRSVIKIACNLAVMAAQTGDGREARTQIERARQLLRHYPGRRLEFFTAYSRGVVEYFLGELSSAGEAFEEALPLGRALGDEHLVVFGEVAVADVALAQGRYAHALQLLRRVRRQADRSDHALLGRLAAARLLLIGTLLGNRRLVARSRKAVETRSLPDGPPLLPGVWSDLFVGLAAALRGDPAARDTLQSALEFFEEVGVPMGQRLARIVLLVDGLLRGDRPALERDLAALRDQSTTTATGFVAAAEALVCAEAHVELGEFDFAEEALARSAGALVGAPAPELDWRIELLRGRLAARAGDQAAARRHVQRGCQVRDLLARLVPERWAATFLAHGRFQRLSVAAARLETFPTVLRSTPELRRAGAFEGLVGRSSAMVRVFHTIDRLRDSDLPVLISGEPGTGKELVARALHRTGPRRRGSFLALHGSSLPEQLFEAEMFGYEKGAFSGAEESRPGILEKLEGGTLLLDDVHELTPASQSKLLDALSAGVIRRVGGFERRPIDVRIISSTSVDLAGEAEAGRFRADLFFRLRVLEIALPPLRERAGDIGPLARHFVERHAARLDRPTPSVTPEAIAALSAHRWPGNVRELEAVLLRVLVGLSRGGVVDAESVETQLPSVESRPLFSDEQLRGRSLDELRHELDRAYVTMLFEEVRGSIPRVMERLGIKRTQVYALFRKLGLDPRGLRRRLR